MSFLTVMRGFRIPSLMLLSAGLTLASPAAADTAGVPIEQSRAIILVAHGLNLRPSKMRPLAEALCSEESRYHCRVLKLQGHEEEGTSQMREVTLQNWKDAFTREVRELQELAEGRPFYFLGFSLGALLGPWGLQNLDERLFEKMALISPPLETRAFSRLVTLIPGPSHWTLPSWNHAEYRANERTSLGAYRALYALQDEIRAGDASRLEIDTLVFVNPNDELVSAQKLRRRAERSQWTRWKIESLAPVEPTLNPVYQHLMIDAASLGQEPWKHLTRALRLHFGVNSNSDYLTPQ